MKLFKLYRAKIEKEEQIDRNHDTKSLNNKSSISSKEQKEKANFIK
jgi:hypothetical protein